MDEMSLGETPPRKRPLRPHAAKALVGRRIRKVIEAWLLGLDDELAIESLLAEGITRRQAKRYLKQAHQELETAGAGASLRQRGLLIKEAEFMAASAYRESRREGGDPQAALSAHKNAVTTLTALEKTGKQRKGEKDASDTGSNPDTQANRLADVLQLFIQQQSNGGPPLPG